jgi:putative sugar O-methyltransferase
MMRENNNFLKRILKIFNIANNEIKLKYKKEKSRHWQIYNYRNFNQETLKNFRKNGILSNGLDDQNDAFSFKIYSELVNNLTEDYILKNSPKKNIGNSASLIKFKNYYIDYNKLIHIHWLKDLEKIFLKNIKSFCEIGGGFGSFQELIIKNYNIKLLSIDLPEANLMNAYYLKKNFPSKKFYLYDNYLLKKKLTQSDFIKNDIFILPPNCEIDNKIKFDLFINTRSMMEMNYNIIEKYFNFIHKHISNNGHFLNINRYEKTSVGKPIRLHEYPYDNNWQVIKSKPSFNQSWIHLHPSPD